jgi:hypothetical protein
MISAFERQSELSDAERAFSAEPVIVSDSRGYLNTGEVETGRRVQQFQLVVR